MDPRRKKLFYRATHRGIKEMDLILGAFVRREIADMPASELDSFEALLDVPDQELYLWVTGAEPATPEHDTPLFQRLRAQPSVAGGGDT